MDRAAATSALRGALRLTRHDGETLTAATGVQIPGVLDDLFATDRALGVTWRGGKASFALWAPTARAVTLQAWPAGAALDGEPRTFEMKRQRDGAWTYRRRARHAVPSLRRAAGRAPATGTPSRCTCRARARSRPTS